MHPDLAKVWKHLVSENLRLKAAGEPPLTSEEMSTFIQQNTKGKFDLSDISDVGLKNMGLSILQGATGNLADEAASGKADPAELIGMRSGGNAVVPGLGDAAAATRAAVGHLSALFGGSPDTQEAMRLRQRVFHEANPSADIAGGVIGTAGAVAALPSSLLARGSGEAVAPWLARSAATNAGVGSVSGFGAGEDAAGRTSGAEIGGAVGAAASLIPGAGEGVAYLRDPERQAIAALKAAGASPARIAARLAEFNAAGKGSLPILGDLTPSLQALTKKVATAAGPDANASLGNELNIRQAGQSGRLLSDMQSSTPQFGSGMPDATASGGALHKANMTWAEGPEGYGGLRVNNPEVANTKFPTNDPEPTPLLGPAGRALATMKQLMFSNGASEAGMSDASRASLAPFEKAAAAEQAAAGGLTGMNPVEEKFAKILQQPYANRALSDAQILTQVGDELQSTDQTSFEKMFQIKDRIAAAEKQAWNADNAPLAKRLGQVRQALDTHLTQNVEGYSAVTEEYARRMGLERALKQGVDAWGSANNAGMQKLVSSLSPDELYQYRLGMASEMAGKLHNAAPETDMGAAFLDASRGGGKSSIAQNDKLKTIFGDQETFDHFMKHAKLESDMAQTNAASTVAPPSTDPGHLAISGARSGLSGRMSFVRGAAVRALAGRSARVYDLNAANATLDLLRTKGTPAIDALLQSFQNNAPGSAMPQLGAGAVGGAAGAMGGHP